MDWVNLYLGLGSNQGDRELMLLRAVNLLDQAFGTHPERISRIRQTQAWGFQGADFLNMCVLYRLRRKGSPEEHASEILVTVKAVEAALGRKPEEIMMNDTGQRIYQDRPIDIDILYYGTETIHSEELTVPHPLIAQRDFVKIPLKEISKPDIRAAFPEIFD